MISYLLLWAVCYTSFYLCLNLTVTEDSRDPAFQITEYGYQRDPIAVRMMMEATEKVLRKCRAIRQV